MSARALPRLALAALCFSAAALAAPATGAGSASGASTGASANSAWDNLWWTRDQQGQRLLQSDQPGEAAQRFADPRREAYADLRAGRYAQAAKLLAPFQDARSEYNRGNALARSGRLQDALSAYDAALARSPADHDARHNRDLVARALRQSQPQSQHGQRGDARQRGGAPPQGGGQSPQLARAAPSDRSAGGAQGAQSAQGAQGAQGAQHSQNAQAPQSSPNAQSPQNAQTAQAMQGATARAQADHGQSGAQPSNALQARAAPRASEQTLSLEQWLRRIPDDPGGLLRQKFLIEHQMRQQSADQ